jgi:hypothetical protein
MSIFFFYCIFIKHTHTHTYIYIYKINFSDIKSVIIKALIYDVSFIHRFFFFFLVFYAMSSLLLGIELLFFMVINKYA